MLKNLLIVDLNVSAVYPNVILTINRDFVITILVEGVFKMSVFPRWSDIVLFSFNKLGVIVPFLFIDINDQLIGSERFVILYMNINPTTIFANIIDGAGV